MENETWIGRYLKLTEIQESPERFHLWAAMFMISSAVGRSVWIDRGAYPLYPNLYVVLVATSGRCRKGVPPRNALSFLRSLDIINLVVEKTTPEGIIVVMKKGEARTSNKGTLHATDSCCVISPEMSVLIGSQQSRAMLDLLTTLYDCHDVWDYNTRTKGEIRLLKPTINILAATQSQHIGQWLDSSALGGGFAGRTLFIVEHKRRGSFAWSGKLCEKLQHQLERDLLRIAGIYGEMPVEAEAKSLFTRWYDSLVEGEQDNTDHRISGFVERKHEHVLKVALILVLSESLGENLLVKWKHIEYAIQIIEEVELSMSGALSLVGATDSFIIGGYIIELIARFGGMIPRSVLISKISQHIHSTTHFDEIMNILEGQKIIETEISSKTTHYRLTEEGKTKFLK